MKQFSILALIFLFNTLAGFGQIQNRNWYFGTGTDGITFDLNNNPVKLNNKVSGVGFEGMIVVNDPATGDLMFYSDGQKVINKNQQVMPNGSGLLGAWSGSQCVQSCPIPGTCAKKFYLFTNSGWDATPGNLYYSIVDFTSNPLGSVTNVNTPITGPQNDQGVCLVNKPLTNDYWLITNVTGTAKYTVWPLTATGIGTPATYSFTQVGEVAQFNYSTVTKKLVVAGYGSRSIGVYDFDAATGVMSNETVIGATYGNFSASRFSPDGTKLYASSYNTKSLFQYDYTTGVLTNMNTCCYAHDLKVGPDNKMYFIHTYNDAQPISVIDFPNKSAVGNACNYHDLIFTPAFNGEVRRFPEIVTLPVPPVAVTDNVTISALVTTIDVLANDYDVQGYPLTLDAIALNPTKGTAAIKNGKIEYTTTATGCGIFDTMIYRIRDGECNYDTAYVFISIQGTGIVRTSNSITICEGLSYNQHTTTGIYNDTFKLVGRCDSINTVNLTVKPKSYSTVTTAICSEQSYEGYKQSGTYKDTFVSASGCDSVRTLNLTVINSSTSSVNKTICAGDSFEGYSVSGTYVDTFLNTGGCDSVRTLILSVTPTPVPYLGNDTIICQQTQLILSPGKFNSYLWQDGSTNEKFTVVTGGTYTVTVSNDCTTSSAAIVVTESSCDVYFPSAFTPNNDGLNDEFKVLSNYTFPTYNLKVYNRFGQKVFETSNPKKGWTGYINGLQADPGAYVWQCDFINKLNNPQQMKGTVVLIR